MSYTDKFMSSGSYATKVVDTGRYATKVYDDAAAYAAKVVDTGRYATKVYDDEASSGAPLPTLTPLVTTVPRGVACHTARLYPAYSGFLGEAQFNGVIHNISALPNGKIDYQDVLTWWEGQPGGGDYVNGPYPRLRASFGQNAAFTGDIVQTNEALMPILDPNNIKADGFWPASFPGYAGRSTTTTGAATSLNEENVQMASSAGTLSSNTGNCSVALVIGSVNNVGTAGTSAPQNAIMGMNNTTGANRWTLRSGDTDWSQRFGFGFLFGTVTKTYPATPLRARINRQVVLVTHSTATPIDGQAQPVSNIRVNGQASESFTQGSTGRISSATSATGFLKIGSDAGGAANSGTAMEFYACILYSNALVSAADGDQRATVENDLISIFNIRTAYTHQFVTISSSTATGYKGAAGNGLLSVLCDNTSDLALSVEGYGHANPNSTLSADIEPNKAFISAVQRAGMTKTYAYVHVRAGSVVSTVGGGTLEANAAFSMAGQFNTDGWSNVLISDYFPSSNASQATFDAERAIFNAAIDSPANEATHGYIAVKPNSLSEVSNFNDYTRFDDTIHTRGGPGGGTIPVAAQLETALRALL